MLQSIIGRDVLPPHGRETLRIAGRRGSVYPPGTRATVSDLAWLRETSIAHSHTNRVFRNLPG